MSSALRWSTRVSAIAAVFAFAFAGPVSAQQAQSPSELLGVSNSSALLLTSAIPLAPALSLAPAATVATGLVPTVELMPVMRRSQSVALMIVGGAALLVGSLVDGDSGTIIMVGGGVAGLIGLYHYLQ